MNRISQQKKADIITVLWLMGDKIGYTGLTLVSTIAIARFLGPDQFGILVFATSTIALFAVAGHAGLSSIIVKELLKSENTQNTVLGSTFIIKVLGYLIGVILIFFSIQLFHGIENTERKLIIMISIGLLFRPFEIIEMWNLATKNVKNSTFSKICSALISSLIRVFLAWMQAPLLIIGVTWVIQPLLNSILLTFFYQRTSQAKITDWKCNVGYVRNLLPSAGLVLLGTLFAAVYLKIDVVMLKVMTNNETVGIYSAAATLSEAWYFVGVAIVTATYPRLIKMRKTSKVQYDSAFQRLYNLQFWLACSAAVITTVLAPYVIQILYGDTFAAASAILQVHVWAGTFVYLRAVFSKWIVIENLYIASVVTQGSGAIINIILNWFLIDIYGARGAAIATLFSYAFASYFSLLFMSKTRIAFVMMTKAMLLPLIIINNRRIL